MKFLVLTLFLHPIITEVMLDPLGPESGSLSPGDRNEFIEIYNPGSDTIDMAFYKIKDNAEIDSIVPFYEITRYYPHVVSTTKIPPKSYGIIMDAEYVIEGENFLPYDLPPGISVMKTADTDIGNGLSANDTIWLIHRSGQAVSTFGVGPGFPLRSKDGISFERKYYFGPDHADNWRYSEDPQGHTIGRINSVSIPFNVGVLSYDCQRIDEYSVRFDFELINRGVDSIRCLYFEYNILENSYGKKEIVSLFLFPDSTTRVSLSPFSLPPGRYTLDLKIGNEDSVVMTLQIGFFTGKPPLVINEIMYKSTVEWVEIYNRSKDTINLRGFSVKDPVRRSKEMEVDYYLYPDSFVVLSSATLNIENCIVLFDFPTLNDRGDTVYLLDSNGFVVDLVAYSSKWGGGSEVSLERLSADLPSEVQYNWGSCKEGSTPGRKNSVSVVLPVQKSIFSLSSKVVCERRGVPFIQVNLEFPESPVWATAELFRFDGRKVETFFQDKYLVDGRYVFSITSRTQTGNLLEEGMYIVVIKGRNKDGMLFVRRELIGILQ